MSVALPGSIERNSLHSATPSFFGIVRGEFIKISRMWQIWLMLLMWLGVITLPYLVQTTNDSTAQRLKEGALAFFYSEMELNLAILRIFSGFFLLILTAYVIGQEYHFGTIRIILARGVGRLQLLGAKVLAVVLVALMLFIVGVLYNIILICALLAIIAGNLNSLSALTPAFWSNTELYMLSVLISMGVTILLAVCVSIVGRGLAFGLSASLAWFAVDNFGLLFLIIAAEATHNTSWLQISAYALGPNLNAMPRVLLPAQLKAIEIGITPLVPIDATHTLLIALVYALIFAVTAIILIWKRDVKE